MPKRVHKQLNRKFTAAEKRDRGWDYRANQFRSARRALAAVTTLGINDPSMIFDTLNRVHHPGNSLPSEYWIFRPSSQEEVIEAQLLASESSKLLLMLSMLSSEYEMNEAGTAIQQRLDEIFVINHILVSLKSRDEVRAEYPEPEDLGAEGRLVPLSPQRMRPWWKLFW